MAKRGKQTPADRTPAHRTHVGRTGQAPRLRMVCGKCRSDEVTRDAWAEWNLEAQSWGLSALFDYAFCHRCQASTKIEECPLDS